VVVLGCSGFVVAPAPATPELLDHPLQHRLRRLILA
jgi:hypothetical protein